MFPRSSGFSQGVSLEVWTITQELKHSVAQNALQTRLQSTKAFQLISVDRDGGFDFNPIHGSFLTLWKPFAVLPSILVMWTVRKREELFLLFHILISVLWLFLCADDTLFFFALCDHCIS